LPLPRASLAKINQLSQAIISFGKTLRLNRGSTPNDQMVSKRLPNFKLKSEVDCQSLVTNKRHFRILSSPTRNAVMTIV
jgi:hypothetical protein